MTLIELLRVSAWKNPTSENVKIYIDREDYFYSENIIDISTENLILYGDCPVVCVGTDIVGGKSVLDIIIEERKD